MKNNRKGAFTIETQFQVRGKTVYYYDLVAVAAGLSLTLYFLLTAKISVGLPDETTFLTIPMRIIHGDRLFIDEWNLPQLSSLCSLLPFKFYVAVTGGTDGCVLFMRYVFIAVNTVFYFYMYCKLRRYKYWAVFAAILFCGVVPQTNFCLTYFTVAPMAIMSACLILLSGEPVTRRGKLFLTGVIIAIGVLTEPFLLILYLLYGAVFLLRKIIFRNRTKHTLYAYLFDNRTFFWMTLGAFFMFLLLMGSLLYAGVLKELPTAITYLFTGVEYNAANLTDLSKLESVFFLFGKVNLAGIVVCIVAAILWRVRFRYNYKLRFVLFLGSVLLLITCYLHCGYKILNGYYATGSVYHEFPMLFFPIIWYLLCKKKNERLFCVWLIGFLSSVLIDYSSDIMLAACGRVTQTVGLICFKNLSCELKTEFFTEIKRRPAVRNAAMLKSVKTAAQTVCIAVIVLWNLYYIVCEGIYKPTEKYFNTKDNAYSAELTYGPYKNLITTADIEQKYYASLRDLDRIKEEAAEADALYIMKLCPYMYLYADMPFGTFSAWDEDPLERHIAYWNYLPQNRPKYIYVSRFNGHSYQALDENDIEAEIRAIEKIADCETTEGEAGYILKITRWKI